MARPPRAEADPRLLTPTELEIMQAVWAHGGGTVAAIAARLPQDRAYTTVATLLAILESKGFLSSSREGGRESGRLIYAAATARPEYERRALRDLLERLFGGSPAALLRALVQAGPIPDEERARLEEAIRAREDQDRDPASDPGKDGGAR